MRPKAFTRRDMVTHIARRIISDYVTAGKIGTGNRPKSPLRDKESFSTSVFFQKERRPAARQQPIVISRDVAKWHGKAVDFPADMANGRNWRGVLELSGVCYAYRESGRKANVTRIAASTDNYQQPIVIFNGLVLRGSLI